MLSAVLKFFEFLFQTISYSILVTGELFLFGTMLVGVIEIFLKRKLSTHGKRALSCCAVCIGVALAIFCSVRDAHPDVAHDALSLGVPSTSESPSCSPSLSSAERITTPSAPESSTPSSQRNNSSFSSETSSVPLTDDITGPLSTPAWWTEGGYSYHFSPSCPSLSRSASVQSGTLSDALDAGKRDPCNICAHG